MLCNAADNLIFFSVKLHSEFGVFLLLPITSYVLFTVFAYVSGLLCHSSILDVQSFKGADCDTDLYLVVAKVRERLAVSEQAAQKFDEDR